MVLGSVVRYYCKKKKCVRIFDQKCCLSAFNWNKYQSKVSSQSLNQHLDYLTDPSFQGITRLFVLSFKNNTNRNSHRRSFLPSVEIKNYYVTIDGSNFFDQIVKNGTRTYENIRKTIIGSKRNDYTTCYFLNYQHVKENTKLIDTDLRKQQDLMLVQKQYNKSVLLEI